MTDIKKLRKLAEKSNPGPWIEKRDPFDVERIHIVDQEDRIICSVRGTTRNCEFIAAANPQAIIEILDRLERYEKALRFYAKDSQFSTGEKMTDSQKRDMDDYGSRAREALEGGKLKEQRDELNDLSETTNYWDQEIDEIVGQP